MKSHSLCQTLEGRADLGHLSLPSRNFPVKGTLSSSVSSERLFSQMDADSQQSVPMERKHIHSLTVHGLDLCLSLKQGEKKIQEIFSAIAVVCLDSCPRINSTMVGVYIVGMRQLKMKTLVLYPSSKQKNRCQTKLQTGSTDTVETISGY